MLAERGKLAPGATVNHLTFHSYENPIIAGSWSCSHGVRQENLCPANCWWSARSRWWECDLDGNHRPAGAQVTGDRQPVPMNSSDGGSCGEIGKEGHWNRGARSSESSGRPQRTGEAENCS